MFEETNVNSLHTDRIFGRMKLVVLEMVADGTNWTVDTANSSPGIATTAGGTTIALTGISKGSNFWFPGSPDTVNSAVTVAITAEDASAGTITLTASAATNGVRFQWFFFVNRTG
jgi:hypothetical protein